MAGVWNWLIGEAGAAWIFGPLGILGLIYGWRNRPRPAKVIIQELETLRLLDIHPAQRDKVKVYYSDERYDNAPIDALQQRELAIFNSGTQDITEPITLLLYITLVGPQYLCRFALETQQEAIEVVALRDNKPGFVAEISYLNSFSVHGEYVRAYIISEGEVVIEKIEGSGKGWSSQFVSQGAIQQAEIKVNRVYGIILLVVGVPLVLCVVLSAFADPRLSLNQKIGAAIGGVLLAALAFAAPPIAVWLRQRFVRWRTKALPISTFRKSE